MRSWENPPPFAIEFTAYINAVDYRGGASLYLPEKWRPTSAYYLNIYQTFRGVHGMDSIGAAVDGSDAEIDKTANQINHYYIDDDATVITATIDAVQTRLSIR